MNRYHYIDDQGNISDALPLEALRKINLAPTTKVLLEGGKQWITLGEVSQGGPVVFPAPPLRSPAATTPPLLPPPPAPQASVVTPLPSDGSPAQQPSTFYPAFFLGVFLGVFGAHRFYVRKIGTGLVQLLTLGGLGIWWFVDMIMILLGKFKDKSGAVIPNVNPKLSWSVFAVVVIIGLASRSGGSGASSSGGSPSSSSSLSAVADPTGTWIEGDRQSVYNRLVIRSSGTFSFQTVDFTGDVKGGYSGRWISSGRSLRFEWGGLADGGSCSGSITEPSSLTFGAATFHR